MAHEAGTAALNLLQGSSGESFWIKEVAWQNYSIPLTKSMSTGESADHRQGLLVKVTLGSSRGGTCLFVMVFIQVKFWCNHFFLRQDNNTEALEMYALYATYTMNLWKMSSNKLHLLLVL